MQIKILNVNPVETKQGPKKKYRVFVLNYSLDQQSRDKSIMEFSPVFKILQAAQPGELYEIESQKNSAGYVDWLSAVKVEGGAAASAPSASAAPAHVHRGLDTQASIHRQVALKLAVEFNQDNWENMAQEYLNWLNDVKPAKDDFQDDVIE